LNTHVPRLRISTHAVIAYTRSLRVDIFTKSPASFIGLSAPQISSMINKEAINVVMGRTSDATAEEQRTHLEREKREGRNKSACKSNNITMTPARTQRITDLISTTGEQEQSAPKKTRSARKKDLLAFLGEGARVQPPSMDGTPIEAAKMRRSPGSGILGTTKKQDNLDSSNAIGRKKSNRMIRNPWRRLQTWRRWMKRRSNLKD
jgi:hypothetical protein